MNKLLILFSFAFIGCSQLKTGERKLASFSRQEEVQFQLKLSSKTVFANGADAVSLSVQIKDELGNILQVKPSELKILADTEIGQTDFKVDGDELSALIRPKVKSSNIRLIIAYKEKFTSKVIELKTTLEAKKTAIEQMPWAPSVSLFVSGLYYGRSDNYTPEFYESFRFENDGVNRIVNSEAYPYSKRNFNFEFEQQAIQNNSMLVVDSPNEFISHGMYSHMMLFPRKYLPHAELDKNKVMVTLATGEQMILDAETGEIVGGVFTEGPVDVSGDRFKRHYADLKYQGKGILLRANARGQMPQQGQFETLKIDMEYGIKGSTEVLIINGTTGQRCRRPKSDFWPSGDVSPIPFKFPSDKEFDAYLRSKCQFGIPDLVDETSKVNDDSALIAQSLWGRCEDQVKSTKTKNYLLNLKEDHLDEGIKSCLNAELSLIENATTRTQVAFDLYPIYIQKRENEYLKIDQKIIDETEKIKKSLLKDVSWIEDETLNGIEGECKLRVNQNGPILLRYNRVKGINSGLLCQEVKKEIIQNIEIDSKTLTKKITSNLQWLDQTEPQTFLEDCKEVALSLIDSEFLYKEKKSLYFSGLVGICKEVEKTPGYVEWLKTKVSALEETAYTEAFQKLDSLSMEKGESCLKEFPMTNVLQRIRFKNQRESCLTSAWDRLEDEAVAYAFKDPIIRKVGVSKDSIKSRLSLEGRRLQLKVIKTYFTSN